MGTPSVTIIIPCFNHGRFVRQAVDSSLAQRDADVRIVVVQDGSTDPDTAAACDACAGERVRIIHQENRGLPAARNRGAFGATTEFLTFLDADDWLEPDFVAKLSAAIARDGGADVSHAYCRERLVEKGHGIWKVPEWDPILMMVTNLHPVTTLIRRDLFEAVGGFDESMRHGYEDWDLWLKFVERGLRGVRVPEPLFIWRRHSHSTMIMNVIRDHAALYAGLRERHRALFDRHAEEVLVRSNTLMNRSEMGWVDDAGEPINLRALKGQRVMYESIVAVRVQRRLQRLLGRKR